MILCNYKIANGESLNDVFNREYTSLLDILGKYRNKKASIVGYSAALATLFSKWCEVYYDKGYKFNDKFSLINYGIIVKLLNWILMIMTI